MEEPLYTTDFLDILTRALTDAIEESQSIELIGMKRVGINNFLRFYVSRKLHEATGKKRLFIFVDLDDLIEKQVFPFWKLMLKRVSDSAQESLDVSTLTKEKISQLFLYALQTGDPFLTFDCVKEALVRLSKEVYTTVFFSRFDRLGDAINVEFFNNLESFVTGSNYRLNYIFTTYREFIRAFPAQSSDNLIVTSTSALYMKPLDDKNREIVLDDFIKNKQVIIPNDIRSEIKKISGGHTQYLHLLFVVFEELQKRQKNVSLKEFRDHATSDERLLMLSQEIWESLTFEEQGVVGTIFAGQKVEDDDRRSAKYLWDTGIVIEEKGENKLFSQLFTSYAKAKADSKEAKSSPELELTKKEHLLFLLLRRNLNSVCEREEIIDNVWPEYKEYGVSDWTIDKLVGRLRDKLKKRSSDVEILTVRTRGYKLIGEGKISL